MTDTRGQTGSGSSNRRRKQAARELLMQRDKKALLAWTARERNPIRTIYSSLWDGEPLICWRAAEALGWVCDDLYSRDPAAVREVIKRLFWSMNDESGNLCWYAGQAIGEILASVADLRDDYLENYFSFLDEEPFEVGLRHGITRLAAAEDLESHHRDLLRNLEPRLVDSLHHADAGIRLYSVLALRSLQLPVPSEAAALEQTEADVYQKASGELSRLSVADITRN